MELNAEQIKKALDWLDSLVGNSYDSDIAMFTYQLLGILYDTCEELTEENERLKARVLEETHLRHQVEEMLANGMSVVRADTVRKMQERLKAEKFTHKNFGELVYVEDIDQIAKELIGDTNDNT